MATMTFSKSLGVLDWPNFGRWEAVSGGWGDPLPAGIYTVERRNITEYTKSIGKGFKDETGKGYFVPLTPHFSTARTGLGIHPDGNLPGTKGCIGIKSSASTFYSAIVLSGRIIGAENPTIVDFSSLMIIFPVNASSPRPERLLQEKWSSKIRLNFRETLCQKMW